MKYIDADKLKKTIEDKGLDCSFALKMERPEVDLEKEIEEWWQN